MNDLYILIPAFNEASRIVDVIERALPYGSVLVVDDGSTDGTDRAAQRAGAQVIRHTTNAGKGAALQTGFLWLRAREIEWVVTLDADGQHLPEEIENLQQAQARTGADVIVGCRDVDPRTMPKARWFGNSLGGAVLHRLGHFTARDVNCGFRLIHADVIRDVPMRLTGMEAEGAWLVDVSRAGYTVNEGLISTVYNDKKSYYRGFWDTVRYVQACFYLVIANDWYWLLRPKRTRPEVVEDLTDDRAEARAIRQSGP
jgi:glycosyltransferase involved in cell wall biosynthesis